MNERDVLIRALEASGNDQGAALARAILPEQPAPTTGTAAPPDEVAAHQSERDRYEAMNQHELAALSEAEHSRAVRLVTGAGA